MFLIVEGGTEKKLVLSHQWVKRNVVSRSRIMLDVRRSRTVMLIS